MHRTKIIDDKYEHDILNPLILKTRLQIILRPIYKLEIDIYDYNCLQKRKILQKNEYVKYV